ncbi:MAG: hypothetical protein WD886_01390 [Burkholderiales bacterium]
MPEEIVQKHLRAALDEVVATEKSRLHEFYDQGDARRAASIKMMSPMIEALKALKTEVSEVTGVSISPAPYGHMASVELQSPGSRESLSISTNFGNTCFTVAETTYYEFPHASIVEKTHEFASADEVLKLVVEAVGKHIALGQVLQERGK